MELGIQAEKSGHFLSILEHELRTNLNGFVGTTQLLSKFISQHQRHNEHINAEDLRMYIDGLQQSSESLQRLLDQLVDFGRLVQGDLEIQQKLIDFSQLLQNLVNTFSSKAREKKLHLVLNYHEQASPTVYGDPRRLQQIMFNLLDNAIKFTDQGDIEIDVTNNSDPHFIEVTVKDTGIGIAAEKINAVFDQFTLAYRGHDGKGYQGLGLGLTLVKRLVEMQGGAVHIASQLNQGTSIAFTLPIRNYAINTKSVVSNLKLLLVDSEDEWQSELNEVPINNQSLRYCSISETNFKLHQEAADWLPDVIIVKSKTLTQQVTNFSRTLKGIQQFSGIRMVLMLPASEQYIYDREQALINGYDSVINNMPLALLNETLATAWSSWQQKGDVIVALQPKQSTNNVLVVEDNLINQKVVKLLLTDLGLNVEVVGSGNKALQAIEEKEYAAVFVDIGLPDINGFEVIKQLRARDDQKSKLPVIVLTADATYRDQSDYRNRGIDAYLVKPLTIQQLRETLTPYFPSLMAV